MKQNPWKVLLPAVLVLAVFLTAVFPAGAVHAQGTDEPTPPPAAGEDGRGGRVLERGLKLEQRFAEHAQKDYDRVPQIEQRVGELIERVRADGEDPAALEAALQAFQGEIGAGHELLVKGQAVLTTHRGFDLSGKEVDPQSARQTLQDARKPLREAHQAYHKALHRLRVEVRKFRADVLPAGG